MDNYFKPQSPLQISSNFVYPIVITDQILIDNGSRQGFITATIDKTLNLMKFVMNLFE